MKPGIPRGYGDNKITLMVRDPLTLYAYWEIRKDVEDKARKKMRDEGLSELKTVLRVYEVTESSRGLARNIVFDFEIKDFADNWYIHTEADGKRWMVDIGILSSSGKFFPLASSNVVVAPSGGITPDTFSSAGFYGLE